MKKQEKTIGELITGLILKNDEIFSGFEIDNFLALPLMHTKFKMDLLLVKRIGSCFNEIFVAILKEVDLLEIDSYVSDLCEFIEKLSFDLSDVDVITFRKFYTNISVATNKYISHTDPYSDTSVIQYLESLDASFISLENGLNEIYDNDETPEDDGTRINSHFLN